MAKVDVEETGAFLAKMKSGLQATISMTVSASGKSDGIAFDIFFSKGSIRWDGYRASELWVSHENDPEDQRGYKLIERVERTRTEDGRFGRFPGLA